VKPSKTVTVNVGGEPFKKETISVAVDGWTSEAITFFLRQTAIEISGQQARMGNLPSSIVVDNSSFKSIERADRKVVILFGTKLATAVINAIKQALAATIDATTEKRTGALRNIDSWVWTYVPGGDRGEARVVDPRNIPMMGFSDRLILRPKAFYATAVNSRVRSGSKAIYFKVGQKASYKRRRNNSQQGFFGAAANMMRRSAAIGRNFSVYAAFTARYAIPGEVWRAGGKQNMTAEIVLRPKLRGRLK
jgi:hypothetical protein